MNTITPNVEPAGPFADLHEARFSTILADPPWPFQNATGKIAPQHRRLWRYSVMSLSEIMALPVAQFAATQTRPLNPQQNKHLSALRPLYAF